MSDFDNTIQVKLRNFRDFLILSAYWYGFAIGFGAAAKSAEETKDTPQGLTSELYPYDIESFTPGFAVLNLNWFYGYASVKVAVEMDDKAKSFMNTFSMGQLHTLNKRYGVNEFTVYDRHELGPKNVHDHWLLVTRIETLAEEMLPAIKIQNSYRHCFSCNELHIVEEFGDKWLCEVCQAKYSLNATVHSASTDTKLQKTEREKMTKKLRFQILERDGFRCKGCGADPRKDNTVVLHVDHIIPISQGGKTVAENLQTLCQNCNLGKGADSVQQMNLWD